MPDHKQPNWADRDTFKRAFERFRFSFIDRGKIKILKKQLKDGNSCLSNMTKSSNELAPLRQRNRIQYEEVDRYREHIAALSAALTEADWGCNCLIPHIANLRSGEPISGASGSSSCCGQEDCRGTNVLFSFHDVVDQPRWNWHEVHFEPITAIFTTPSTSQNHHLTQSHDQSHLNPPTGQSVVRNKLKKRRVHFEADKAPTQVVASSSSSTPPRNKLEKLCASLLSVREGGPPLGYIPTASTTQLVLYPVQRHPRPLKGTAGNMVSLEDMLSDMAATRLQKDTAVRTRRAYMKMDERLYLAYVSSWVFLRLYATPWLGSTWSSRTIRFLQRLDHTKRPFTCEPFVSKPFWASLKEGAGEQADLGTITTTPGSEDSLGSSTTSSSTLFSEDPTVRHRNYGVFMLGVSLLELLFDKKITDLYTKKDLGKDGINEYTMLTAATRLVEKAYEEAGERFGSAVRRCIFCEFDQRYNDVNDPDFRKAFYDGVVAPLGEHWRTFSGGRRPS